MSDTKKIEIELTLDSDVNVKSDEAQDSLNKVKDGASGAENELVKAGKASEFFNAEMVAVGAVMVSVFSRGLGALQSFASGATDAYRNIEENEMRLRHAIESRNDEMGFTVERMENLQTLYEETTRFAGGDILEAQAILARFGNLSVDVFENTLKASMDLAEAGFGSLNQNVKTLGRVLQNPAQGFTMLERQMGITFTQTQKDVINGFVEMGEEAKAQELILRTVQNRFDGVSEAMAQTDTGQIEQLNVKLGNFQEEVGRALTLVKAQFVPILTTGLERVTNGFEKVVNFTHAFTLNLSHLRPVLLGAASALSVLASGWLIYTIYVNKAAIATALATGGFTIAVAAIGALVAGIASSEKALDGLTQMFTSAVNLIKDIWANLPEFISTGAELLYDVLTLPMRQWFTFQKNIFDSFIGNFGKILQAFRKMVTGDFSGAWNIVKDISAEGLESIQEDFAENNRKTAERAAEFADSFNLRHHLAEAREGATDFYTGIVEAFTFVVDENEADISQNLASFNPVLSDDEMDDEFDRYAEYLQSLTGIQSEDADENIEIYTDLHDAKDDIEEDFFTKAVKRRQELFGISQDLAEGEQKTAESIMKQTLTLDRQRIKSGKDVLKASLDNMKSAINARIAEAMILQFRNVMATIPFPFNVGVATAASGLVKITLDRVLKSVAGFQDGGLIGGGHKLIQVNEDGKSEFIVNAKSTQNAPELLNIVNKSPDFAKTLNEMITGRKSFDGFVNGGMVDGSAQALQSFNIPDFGNSQNRVVDAIQILTDKITGLRFELGFDELYAGWENGRDNFESVNIITD